MNALHKKWMTVFLFLLAVVILPGFAANADPIHVMVITGGHGFDPQFFSLFEGHPDIQYDKMEQPNANAIFTDGTAKKYDVLVFYDLWQEITDAQKQGLIDYLKSGKGLVSLHHSIADYQNWPEYLNVTGVKYFLDAKGGTVDGKTFPQSTYQEDVEMNIHIADSEHPLTRGLRDFQITDEAYKYYYVKPDIHRLLTTDYSNNEPTIAWTHNYEGNEIVYIQLGHSVQAYQNPNYRFLVAQAIRWTAKRPLAEPLFNGHDLSDFQAEGQATWAVKDGLLTGHQGPGNAPGDLLTKKSYSDFELTIEFKVDWPANSGVWFRYQTPQIAYQADILEYKNPVCWSGSLYCPEGGPFLAMNEKPEIVNREGWNSFAIVCQGDHLTIHLNGTQVADVHNKISAEGKIGFQVHPGEEFAKMGITIRNAFILSLEK